MVLRLATLPHTCPPGFPLLKEGPAWGWLSPFERLDGGISTTQGVSPFSKVKELLESTGI